MVVEEGKEEEKEKEKMGEMGLESWLEVQLLTAANRTAWRRRRRTVKNNPLEEIFSGI